MEGFPKIENKPNRFKRLFEVLKRGTVIGMVGLATAQGVEGKLGTYIGHYREAATANENLGKTGERKLLSNKDIYNLVIYDESERMFLGNDRGLYEVGGGGKDSGLVAFEDIQDLIDRGERSPIFAHTHPISVYDNVGYSVEDIKDMKINNEVPAPMPPSITDIIGMVDAVRHFNDQNIEIRGRIYDPTGMWEYSIDSGQPSIKLFLDFRSNMNIENTLTEAERDTMQKFGIFKIHPTKRIETLKSDPRTLEIGEKLELASNNYFESLSDETKTTLEKFAELEFMSSNLAKTQKAGNQDQVKILIQEYIKAGSELGIQFSYVANK